MNNILNEIKCQLSCISRENTSTTKSHYILIFVKFIHKNKDLIFQHECLKNAIQNKILDIQKYYRKNNNNITKFDLYCFDILADPEIEEFDSESLIIDI